MFRWRDASEGDREWPEFRRGCGGGISRRIGFDKMLAGAQILTGEQFCSSPKIAANLANLATSANFGRLWVILGDIV